MLALGARAPSGESYGRSVVGLHDLNGDGRNEIGFSGNAFDVLVYDGQTGLPLGSGPNSVSPGDTRYFQHWYRDPDKIGGTGFNLTDGTAITFCP